MKRSVLVVFSLILIAAGIWGYTDPSSSIQWMLSTNPNFDILRYGLAIGFLLIAAYPKSQDNGVETLLKSTGIAFLALAMIALFTPTYWGLSGYYMLPLDFVLSLLCGIVCLLTALDMEEAKDAEEVYARATQAGLLHMLHTSDEQEQTAQSYSKPSNA